jgi:hypothetical protein
MRYFNRRRLIVMAVVFALALLATSTTLASPYSQSTVEYIQISDVTTVPCANNGAGEEVAYGGTIRVTMRTTVLGPFTLVQEIYDVVSVTGVGLTTGTRYIGTGTTRSAYWARTGGNSVNALWNVFNMIGEGSAPDLRVRALLIDRMNAAGEVTRSVQRVHISCQ